MRPYMKNLQRQLFEVETKIKNYQDKCLHENKTGEHGANTGNYDPSADCYWIDYQCTDCDKRWHVDTEEIFVFGSNLAGRHGKGAALYARKYFGAIYGRGVGRQGYSYAIPTKDENLKVLPLQTIALYVEQFLQDARYHLRDLTFTVTRIGCGLAGYKVDQIKPLFEGAPSNCYFDWEGKTYGEPKN